MGFNCGIVGLPNVGKSTLFNALTETAAAEAANYPFCTIEPNTGRVAVPDPRLDALASLAGSATVIPTQLEFVDIAGLVRGASKGEGLGNQFLANVRETDAIAHVLRCFDDSEITHVDGSVDPLRDAATVETELMLADIESLERRMAALVKKTRGGDAEAKRDLALMEKLFARLSEGVPARRAEGLTADETLRLPQLQLLSAKPVLYVCNVGENDVISGNDYVDQVRKEIGNKDSEIIIISAKIESEINELDSYEEKKIFLDDLGLDDSGSNKLIRASYKLLNLHSYFTAGVKEVRGWTIKIGDSAYDAAGQIHTDFQKGFIRAEVIGYDDFIAHKGEQGAKDAGRWRLEGKEYILADGDVIHFRFNV